MHNLLEKLVAIRPKKDLIKWPSSSEISFAWGSSNLNCLVIYKQGMLIEKINPCVIHHVSVEALTTSWWYHRGPLVDQQTFRTFCLSSMTNCCLCPSIVEDKLCVTKNMCNCRFHNPILFSSIVTSTNEPHQLAWSTRGWHMWSKNYLPFRNTSVYTSFFVGSFLVIHSMFCGYVRLFEVLYLILSWRFQFPFD